MPYLPCYVCLSVRVATLGNHCFLNPDSEGAKLNLIKRPSPDKVVDISVRALQSRKRLFIGFAGSRLCFLAISRIPLREVVSMNF